MNEKDKEKAAREREIFTKFCNAAKLPLDLGSVKSEIVPNPDVSCMIGGRKYFAELVEIADEDVAKMTAISTKTGKSKATFYSSKDPLIKSFQEKSKIDYMLNGTPLIILAYYEKQSPPRFDSDFIKRNISDISRKMINAGKWKSVWIYNNWSDNILLKL